MAEVLQPFAQSSPSMAGMLQSRSPTSESFQVQQSQRQSPNTRSYPSTHSVVPGTYRATATAPVQPYAFQSTPNLRQDTRLGQNSAAGSGAQTQKSKAATPSDKPVTPPQSVGGVRSPASREDLNRPQSVISLSSSVPDLTLGSFETTTKSSPERYRRSSSRKVDSVSGSAFPSPSSAAPSGSGMSAVEHLYIPPPAPPVVHRASSDDAQTKSAEAAKRYRRRSTANPDLAAASSPGTDDTAKSTVRPVSRHQRHVSDGSAHSVHTIASSVESDKSKPSPPSPKAVRRELSPSRSGVRGSTDQSKRVTNPSPLSRPAFSPDEQAKQPVSPQKSITTANSPAAQHLAALSDKDLNKGVKSRLRRAFSFGSAAELRKASAPRPAGENLPTTRPSDQHSADDLDEEAREIARRQEAAGIGAGIYSGQGGFSGSTDNLSISSTASSASVMLRKMGKGMKKGGRSLKGLFRPKSVIGVPAADGPIQPSLAEVSMVTVEAERQRVNVNVNVGDQADGGTGFPKLEQNSAENPPHASDARSSAERNDSLRKSIVGSDKDRQEVLAAVKKGILKRSGTSSPSASPVIRPQNASVTDLPRTGSPVGSIPATPKDERKSRSLSSQNSSNNDYFSPRLNMSTRSMPATPQPKGNISFSPRIQFHDVWSSTEYDRRGEIATCNRLTPMLAQQIKEELNTFKMEMEVHELSKPHTHFF